LHTRYTGAMGSRVVEAEYEKGMLKPSTPLTLRPGERVHLIVMRQPDPKRWDLSRLARSPAAMTRFSPSRAWRAGRRTLMQRIANQLRAIPPSALPKKMWDLTEEETSELELATDEALGRVEPPPK